MNEFHLILKDWHVIGMGVTIVAMVFKPQMLEFFDTLILMFEIKLKADQDKPTHFNAGFGAPKTVCFIEARPQTGKTHQIRAHLELAGFPILLDHLYGPWKGELLNMKEVICSRMLLHARTLQFKHPKSGELLKIEAPLPQDFEGCLGVFGFKSPKDQC